MRGRTAQRARQPVGLRNPDEEARIGNPLCVATREDQAALQENGGEDGERRRSQPVGRNKRSALRRIGATATQHCDSPLRRTVLFPQRATSRQRTASASDPAGGPTHGVHFTSPRETQHSHWCSAIVGSRDELDPTYALTGQIDVPLTEGFYHCHPPLGLHILLSQ